MVRRRGCGRGNHGKYQKGVASISILEHDVSDLDLDRSKDSEGLIGEGPGGSSSDGGLVFPSVFFESAINGQILAINKQQAPQAQQVPPPGSQKDGATNKQVPSQGFQKVNGDVIHARDKGKAKAGSASPLSSKDGPSRPSKDYSSKSGTSFSPVTFQDLLEASLARKGESSKGDGPNVGGLDPLTLGSW